MRHRATRASSTLGERRTLRPLAAGAILSIAVTVGALPLDPWPAVAAAGACPVPPPSAQPPPSTQPWAQQRFDPARLASFADGHDVKVAVIDSGVDPDHPQMHGHVLAGADFIDTQGDGRQDCIGHGTAVASLIVAQPIASTPFRGLAPGASIMSIRVSEQENTQGGLSGRVPPLPEQMALLSKFIRVRRML